MQLVRFNVLTGEQPQHVHSECLTSEFGYFESNAVKSPYGLTHIFHEARPQARTLDTSDRHDTYLRYSLSVSGDLFSQGITERRMPFLR